MSPESECTSCSLFLSVFWQVPPSTIFRKHVSPPLFLSVCHVLTSLFLFSAGCECSLTLSFFLHLISLSFCASQSVSVSHELACFPSPHMSLPCYSSVCVFYFTPPPSFFFFLLMCSVLFVLLESEFSFCISFSIFLFLFLQMQFIFNKLTLFFSDVLSLISSSILVVLMVF